MAKIHGGFLVFGQWLILWCLQNVIGAKKKVLAILNFFKIMSISLHPLKQHHLVTG